MMCVARLAMELLLMSAWQSLGNLQPMTNDITMSNAVNLPINVGTSRFVVDEYVQCGVPSGGSKSMFILVVVEKALMFVFGALMAFTTRKVSSTFNESSGITLAIYNVCFTIGIIAPIILVISAVGDVLILLLAFALMWIAYFTGGILFVPKVMQVVYHTDDVGQMNTSIQASSSSGSGYAFMSLAALTNVPVLQVYQAAIEKHLSQVKTKIAHLKGDNGDGKAHQLSTLVNATLSSKRAATHVRALSRGDSNSKEKNGDAVDVLSQPGIVRMNSDSTGNADVNGTSAVTGKRIMLASPQPHRTPSSSRG
jgi:hypothetical protein